MRARHSWEGQADSKLGRIKAQGCDAFFLGNGGSLRPSLLTQSVGQCLPLNFRQRPELETALSIGGSKGYFVWLALLVSPTQALCAALPEYFSLSLPVVRIGRLVSYEIGACQLGSLFRIEISRKAHTFPNAGSHSRLEGLE